MEILNQLIRKVRDELSSLENSDESEQITKHFNNTIAHLKLRMETSEGDREVYKGLNLSAEELTDGHVAKKVAEVQ